ncbi:MAG: hypothetical protein AAB975_01445 [Patescibacteria group bacterium]
MNVPPYRLPYKDDTDDNMYTVNPEEEKGLEDEVETDEELAIGRTVKK